MHYSVIVSLSDITIDVIRNKKYKKTVRVLLKGCCDHVRWRTDSPRYTCKSPIDISDNLKYLYVFTERANVSIDEYIMHNLIGVKTIKQPSLSNKS